MLLPDIGKGIGSHCPDALSVDRDREDLVARQRHDIIYDICALRDSVFAAWHDAAALVRNHGRDLIGLCIPRRKICGQAIVVPDVLDGVNIRGGGRLSVQGPPGKVIALVRRRLQLYPVSFLIFPDPAHAASVRRGNIDVHPVSHRAENRRDVHVFPDVFELAGRRRGDRPSVRHEAFEAVTLVRFCFDRHISAVLDIASAGHRSGVIVIAANSHKAGDSLKTRRDVPVRYDIVQMKLCPGRNLFSVFVPAAEAEVVVCGLSQHSAPAVLHAPAARHVAALPGRCLDTDIVIIGGDGHGHGIGHGRCLLGRGDNRNRSCALTGGYRKFPVRINEGAGAGLPGKRPDDFIAESVLSADVGLELHALACRDIRGARHDDDLFHNGLRPGHLDRGRDGHLMCLSGVVSG